MSKKTVSAAQLAANRANARKSTGPKTPRGKAASSRNAIKHGLTAQRYLVLPGDPAGTQSDLVALFRALTARFQPRGYAEALLLQRIAVARWHLARVSRLKAHAVPNNREDGHPPAAQPAPSAAGEAALLVPNPQSAIRTPQSRPAPQTTPTQDDLTTISRHSSRIRGQLKKAVAQFLRVQAERLAADSFSSPTPCKWPVSPRPREPKNRILDPARANYCQNEAIPREGILPPSARRAPRQCAVPTARSRL